MLIKGSSMSRGVFLPLLAVAFPFPIVSIF